MAERDRDRGRRGNPNPNLAVDYKDTKTLKRFLSEDGKILPRRRTGLSAKNQRAITTAIKRARHLALLPFTSRE
jgi:small subunit ribosomal protein S18